MGNTFRTGKLMNGLYVDDSGNVGINTTSPSYKLDVNGTARITGAATFSSNIGVGATLSSWISTTRALQLNDTASLFAPSAEAILGNNIYVNSSDNNTYITTNYASQYRQVNGQHLFYSAASGTAGTTISFGTPKLTITSSGNVGIGTTSPALTQSNRTTLDIGNATESLLVLSTGGTWRSYLYNDGTNLSIANSGGFINFDVLGERMRITNTGRVGIGTSSPGYRLHSVGAGAGSGWSVLLENNNKIGAYISHADGYGMALDSAANGTEYILKAAGGDGTNKGVYEYMKVFANGETRFTGNSGSGQTMFSIYDGSARRVFCIPSQYYGYIFAVSVASNGGKAISIGNAGGSSEVGSIVANASSTTYNTSSDYRLKEDLKDFDGLDILSKIKFYDFKWKSEDARSTGVIAHELQEVVPYAVQGEKDEIGKDDKPSYQGVDYSKLVAIMGKAIQELSAKVTALENK